MKTSLKAGFAQIFSCCPKNLSCAKFGGLQPPSPLGQYAYAGKFCPARRYNDIAERRVNPVAISSSIHLAYVISRNQIKYREITLFGA